MIINALLFDLDGTLIDTAPDLVESVQLLRERHGRSRLSYDEIRPSIPNGSPAMVKAGFNDINDADQLESLRLELFEIYVDQLLVQPLIFEGLDQEIQAWEKSGKPWGIVTNKPTAFTEPLLKHLGLDQRIAVLVCGDTLPKRKPNPDTLIHAAKALDLPTQECVYVGDDQRDVIACGKADMPCVVAAYDFIPEGEDPTQWNGIDILWHAHELGACLQRLAD